MNPAHIAAKTGADHNNPKSTHICDKFPMLPDSDYPETHKPCTLETGTKRGTTKTNKQRRVTDDEIR